MKHVSIEILQRCPNNCMHCSSNSKMQCSTKDMDVSLIKKVFDGLQNLNAEEVSISGGEPFLHKKLVDIVEYGTEKGFKFQGRGLTPPSLEGIRF